MGILDNESNRVVFNQGAHLSFKVQTAMQNTSQKFFLYARKSTDVEDKQVLSIESQLAELREYAAREKLFIVEELIEKQSAKIPGRPLFDSMLERIEKDEASELINCRHHRP